MNNRTDETNKKTKPGKYAKRDNANGRRIGVISIIAIIIIIIILLLLRCCGSCNLGNPTTPTEPTVGDFDISDGPQATTSPTTPTETTDMPMIIFTGRGEYYVSNTSPNIELRNSEKNKDLGVDMVFTIIDAETNEVIARTSKVAPGQYVYVNVVNHYATPGTYNIIVEIGVTDKNGNALNGMNQEAIVRVLDQ